MKKVGLEEETFHDMQPRKYKMDETKKQQILASIKQEERRNRTKMTWYYKIVSSVGIGVAALLAFILFSTPFMNSLEEEFQPLNETRSPGNVDNKLFIENMFDSDQLDVRLLNETFVENKVRGDVRFAFPPSVLMNEDVDQISFRVKISNSIASVMSHKYNGDQIFIKETGDGQFSFEIPLSEEEMSPLQEEEVSLQLYAYNEAGSDKTQAVASKQLLDHTPLHVLGAISDDLIQDMLSSENVSTELSNFQRAQLKESNQIIGLVNLSVPRISAYNVDPSELAYAIRIHGGGIDTFTEQYHGKEIEFHGRTNTIVILMDTEVKHLVKGDLQLELHVYGHPNKEIQESAQTIQIGHINIEALDHIE